jgi:dTDP-4-dehydrorhamnose 3,5-epimerase-like enzyme
MTSKFNSTSGVRLISLSQFKADSGVLSVAQIQQHIPFKVERTFTVISSRADVRRGYHAHITLNQFMICITGEIEIVVDDCKSKNTFFLNGPNKGLIVPAGIWSEQIYKSENAILLVLCDRTYDEVDYIRDYDDFCLFKRLNAKE